MKSIYTFSVLVLIFLAGLFIINSQYQPKTTSSTTSKTNTNNGTGEEFIDIDFNNQQIRAVSFKIDNPAKISLIPNFEEKSTAFEVTEKYSCKDLINGGFYSKGNLPIGLFVTDDKKIGNFTQNLLFNGFFKISRDEIATISNDSSGNLRLALQSGPILIQNGYPLRLQIIDDKPERRAVVALTQNEVYFIVFYNKNSVYLGPLLTNLPEFTRIFGQQKNIKIIDALNLDGGTASAFRSGNISLPELSQAGSFFCIKN